MSAVFPFNLPFPTAFYLTAYLVTLFVHVVFMNYVLAGSAYVALKCLLGRRWDGTRESSGGSRSEDLIFDTLRDWLPFVTGAAITAGVAPLLFLQVLYKRNFYTANLLLFHRWMFIVPVLIVGFYLLYVLKTPQLVQGRPVIRLAAALGAFAAFAFTAWSWSENHLLSLDSKAWPTIYEKGGMTHFTPAALVRVLAWVSGAFPTMVTIIAWQLRKSLVHANHRPILLSLSKHANGFLVLAMFATGISVAMLMNPKNLNADERSRDFLGQSAKLFVLMFVIGVIVQLIAWMMQSRREDLGLGWLIASTLALGVTLISALVLREAFRMASVDLPSLYPQHADAFRVGGLPIFVICIAINAILIACCIRLVFPHRPHVQRP